MKLKIIAIILLLTFLVSNASAACSGTSTCTTSKTCSTCPAVKTCSTCTSCVPNFTFAKSGKTVQFKDATPKGKYWHWDFNNDGKIDSYMKNPKYTFTKTGAYKVCLTVSCGGTSGWQKVCKTVTV
jgi:PKD repeat protein